MGSPVDCLRINRSYIQILSKKIELDFYQSISDKNLAFGNQSMTITALVNSFTRSLDD